MVMPSQHENELPAEVHKTATEVYVVEDHPILRRHMIRFVDALGGFKVIGQASSAEAALGDREHKRAELFLTDFKLPGLTGIELCQQLLEENPYYLIVLLTGHSEASLAEQAFAAGARAYIVKDNPQILESVLQRVIKGESEIVVLA